MRSVIVSCISIQLIDRLASVNFRLSESLLTEAKALITAG